MPSATYDGSVYGWELVATPTMDPAQGFGTDVDSNRTLEWTVDYEHDTGSAGDPITFPVNVTFDSEVTVESVSSPFANSPKPIIEYVFTVRMPQAAIEATVPAGMTITQIQANASIAWDYSVATFILAQGRCNIVMGGSGGASAMGWQAFSPGEELNGTDTGSLLSAVVSIARDDFYAHTRNQFIFKNKAFGIDTARLIRGNRQGSTPGSNLPHFTATLDMTLDSVEIFWEDPGPPELEMTGSGGMEIDSSLGAIIVLSADSSGMYTIVPGQHFDRVYTRISDPAETEDVAIPTPFAKTGYFGA